MSKNCPIMQRIKSNYESRSQTHLTRRIPVIMRVDGKAFHTYTKGLNKPFDGELMDDMDNTAIHLCQNIQGAKCAYVQSDEISILITDYDTLQTDAWFDYNVQKMCSISAGYAAGKFNQLRLLRIIDKPQTRTIAVNDVSSITLANFDSRVANYPKEEVANYFLARQKDAVKNSIASVAQSLYSPKELHGKNDNQQQELIFQKGINWNDFSVGEKRGRFIVKNTYWNGELVISKEVLDKYGDYNIEQYTKNIVLIDEVFYEEDEVITPTIRTKWEVIETPLTFNEQNFEQWL